MVAASLGLPVANAQPPESGSVSGKSANTLFVGNAVRFENLIRLRDTARRPGLSADYWHQHAIRVVIRHLSFSLPQLQAQVQHPLLPLTAQKIAVLQSLHALLTTHNPVCPPPRSGVHYLPFSNPALTVACGFPGFRVSGPGPYSLRSDSPGRKPPNFAASELN